MTQTETATQTKQVILRKRESGIAFVIIDSGAKVNSLSSSTSTEFYEILVRVGKDPSIKGVAIISGKADSFIHGADLHEIMKFEDSQSAYQLVHRGQEMATYLDNFEKPTVAAMIGPALGGGLELSLGADRRIAVDTPITQLGLPEVRLGLIPGLGGTQRLPRLVGVKNALEIIISGEPIGAKRALEIGLIDELVTSDQLLERAEALCLELAGMPKSKRLKAAPRMEAEKEARLLAMTERSLRIKTKGRYPAYQKAIDSIKTGLASGIEVGLEFEARAFSELSVSDTSKNLVFLYLSTEFARQTAIAAARKFPPAGPLTVGIVGGGLMGTELARAGALNGLPVVCKAADPARQELFMSNLQDSLQNSQSEKEQQAAAMIRSGAAKDGLERVTIVIEACREDKQLKQRIIKELAQQVQPNTVITTNTSGFSIAELAEQIPDNKNFLGMHFFHPVDRMPLVEVITHPQSDKAAIGQAFGLAHSLGKIPMRVKDSPAFLVNRLLCSFLSEAGYLAEEKIPVSWIEDAALDFGMPMGPMTLLDEVGLDVAISVAKVLTSAFGSRVTPPACLESGVRCGLTGKKSREGVYRWNESGKKLEINPKVESELGLVASCEEKISTEKAQALAEAMLLPMVDEASRCLEEGVVRRAREIDLCMVLGLGFPPFRGGLLRWADTIGVKVLIEKLETIYSKRGPTREVSNYLRKLERENRGFYARGAEEN